jgi:hypothetical protein
VSIHLSGTDRTASASTARAIGTVLFCGACLSGRVKSAEPIGTDRPDFTEATATVDRGAIQVESGLTFARTGEEKERTIGEVLVRVGTSDRTELRVGLNSYLISSAAGARASGLEDAAIGGKVRLLRGGTAGSLQPAISLVAFTSLPTGSSTFGDSKLQPAAKLAASWDLTPRVAWSSNLNYALVRQEARSYGEWAASGSLGMSLSERVGSYVEYFGNYPLVAGGRDGHYVNGGFTFGIGLSAQLDARAGVGLHDVNGPNYFLGIGFAKRW